ncbi:hypothetical protein CDAR_605521 [Caerostris darwini]|uniref:Uncharacterized protein n=1 Tax=Caerostris darwini TaxID=1538125 RepID=A0AAV4REJ8_9ARAC|nr:hypothetical protein CDAR_605521 [Caerostris darwini]
MQHLEQEKNKDDYNFQWIKCSFSHENGAFLERYSFPSKVIRYGPLAFSIPLLTSETREARVRNEMITRRSKGCWPKFRSSLLLVDGRCFCVTPDAVAHCFLIALLFLWKMLAEDSLKKIGRSGRFFSPVSLFLASSSYVMASSKR